MMKRNKLSLGMKYAPQVKWLPVSVSKLLMVKCRRRKIQHSFLAAAAEIVIIFAVLLLNALEQHGIDSDYAAECSGSSICYMAVRPQKQIG